ncbi:hypothetical protein RRG08_003141 [Elysia crispata]|uniref:Uncharacterized protein n=1 Tax=Elysia crispata TaxID=231223 RepID=A0AAE1B8C2_9GAST|nr:hypothetical protein RRG08_003141 [Elysia crispata]
MFNKRRRAEVKDLKVQDYNKRPNRKDEGGKEFEQSMSTTDKIMYKRMDMVISAAGKLTKDVDAYVLLPPDGKEAIEVLIKTRQEYPERINSRNLRKYISTVCQIMDMSDKEVEQLTGHLGHDTKTHKEFYRLAHSTVELSKVSQLLMAIEQGEVNKWHGKGLTEISIGACSSCDCDDDTMDAAEPHDQVVDIETNIETNVAVCEAGGISTSFPFLGRPATDVCSTCTQFRSRVQNGSQTEEEKPAHTGLGSRCLLCGIHAKLIGADFKHFKASISSSFTLWAAHKPAVPGCDAKTKHPSLFLVKEGSHINLES